MERKKQLVSQSAAENPFRGAKLDWDNLGEEPVEVVPKQVIDQKMKWTHSMGDRPGSLPFLKDLSDLGDFDKKLEQD